MSPLAQYVAAGLGLLLLGAIHGALRNCAEALARIAVAEETVVERGVIHNTANVRELHGSRRPPTGP